MSRPPVPRPRSDQSPALGPCVPPSARQASTVSYVTVQPQTRGLRDSVSKAKTRWATLQSVRRGPAKVERPDLPFPW